MAATPQFAATPKIGAAALSAANANRDGTGTVVTILTAGGNGTRVNRVEVRAIAATTAGMVRLFLYDGATYHLWAEVAVAAITPSATLAAFVATLSDATNIDVLPLLLPSGWSLRAATEKAEAFRVIVHGADL